MSLPLRQFIFGSTICALFSSAATIDVGVGLQLWHVLLIGNLALFGWMRLIRVNPGWLATVAWLILSGAAGCFAGTDSVPLAAKQTAGITLSSLYFLCFFRMCEWDVTCAFRAYVQGAYYVAIIGIAKFALTAVLWHRVERLNSILSEPAVYAMVTVPALFFCADRLFAKRSYGREFAILAVGMLLSGSSLGFLAILFSIALFSLRSGKRALFAPLLIALVFAGLLLTSEDFRLRMFDTAASLATSNVEDANLSTYALLSNAFVTSRVFEEHPLAGGGIGSHSLSHSRLISDLPGVEVFEEMMMHELNSQDANSLLLRVVSELGLLGLAAVLFYVWRYRRSLPGEHRAIRDAILVYFAVKLLRAGHYFSPEQFFFIVAYYVNARSAAVQHRLTEAPVRLRLSEAAV